MQRLAKIFWLIFGLLALMGVVMLGWPTDPTPAPNSPATPSLPLSVAPQTPVVAPSPAPTGPVVIQHPIEALSTPSPVEGSVLPALDASDAPLRRGLAAFISNKDFLYFLQGGQWVRHLVATVDNLPRESASTVVWPVNPMPGHFSTGNGDGSHPLGPTTIHPGNSARYTAFVNFVTALDKASAVALYVRFYPLFQQAYQELGYPNAYFNDRLIAVIDHLLAAPVQLAPLAVSRVEVKGPYQPVRPWITYEFTDPELRALSAGQKMLLRAGAVNHQRLRTQLMAFRALLTATPPPRP